MKRLAGVFAGVAALVTVAGVVPALAETKVEVQTTASTDYVPAWLAEEKGLFDKEGVDANFAIATNPGTLPAALQGGSIQIATITAPQLATAKAAGLDFVAIASGGREHKAHPIISVVVGKDSGIQSPADFAGKAIAVPAVGAVLDIGFKQWLKSKGVDPSSVRFVEMGFQQMPDALKSGNAAGALLPEPFRSRIVDSGVGTRAGDFIAEVAGDTTLSLYVTTRAWAEENKDAVAGFQKALAAGADMVATDEDAARAAAGKYLKLPPPVLATIPLPKGAMTAVAPNEVQFWLDTCADLGIVPEKMSADDLIWH